MFISWVVGSSRPGIVKAKALGEWWGGAQQNQQEKWKLLRVRQNKDELPIPLGIVNK